MKVNVRSLDRVSEVRACYPNAHYIKNMTDVQGKNVKKYLAPKNRQLDRNKITRRVVQPGSTRGGGIVNS